MPQHDLLLAIFFLCNAAPSPCCRASSSRALLQYRRHGLPKRPGPPVLLLQAPEPLLLSPLRHALSCCRAAPVPACHKASSALLRLISSCAAPVPPPASSTRTGTVGTEQQAGPARAPQDAAVLARAAPSCCRATGRRRPCPAPCAPCRACSAATTNRSETARNRAAVATFSVKFDHHDASPR
jgi:hypothetical protein